MKKKSAPQSAFFKLRVLVAVLLCFAAITLVLFAFGKASAQPRPPAPNQQPLIRAQYRGVMPVVKFDISPPLRTIKPLLPKGCTLRENEEEGPIPLGPVGRVVRDPVVQRVLGKIGIPAPLISFDGNSNLCGCSPPDPNGGSRSQQCRDDGQPAFPNLRQEREFALWPGRKQYPVGWIWRPLPD
jgi:hypothetical protein